VFLLKKSFWQLILSGGRRINKNVIRADLNSNFVWIAAVGNALKSFLLPKMGMLAFTI
jgi:hypothetical protein